MNNRSGSKHRAASCSLMREAMLKRFQDPAYREKNREQLLKSWTPENRDKTIQAMKDGWARRRESMPPKAVKPRVYGKRKKPLTVQERAAINAEKARQYLAGHGFMV